MNREDILSLLEKATTKQEVFYLWINWIRVSNSTLEFEQHCPKGLEIW